MLVNRDGMGVKVFRVVLKRIESLIDPAKSLFLLHCR